MDTGRDFTAKIGKLGCALFLALAVLVTAICLTQGRDPIPGYTAPADTAYWQAHPEELCRELEDNVFPALEGEPACTVSEGGVTVTIASDSYAVTRGAILRYFDRSLFTFARS